MEAMRRVLDALEELRGVLQTISVTYPEERWNRLRLDLAPILDAFERAEERREWEQILEQIDDLRDRYGLLRDSWGVDGDRDGYDDMTTFRGGASYEGRRGASEPPMRSAKDLGETLRRLVGIDKPAPITTYPFIEVPEEVVEKTVFRLEVGARAQPADDTEELAVLPRSRPGPVDLEVLVELPDDGSITARCALAQPLRVPEQGDSATLGFRLFAERRGKHTIVVRFRQRGRERAVLHRDVGVVPAAEAATSPPVAVAGRTTVALWSEGEPFVGLRLCVEDRGPGRDLRVRLEGPTALLVAPIEATHPVEPSMVGRLTRLCHDMETAMNLDRHDSRESRLINIGAELSKALLPEPIRRALAVAPEGTALHVEARDAWAPWEMLWLAGTGFFGEHFALTRWLPLGSMRDRLPGGRAILVVPKRTDLGRPLNVEAERAALHALSGAPAQELGDVADVQARLLVVEAIGFLHFACHGSTPPDQPLGGMLRLDGGSLRQIDVRDPSVNGGVAPLAGACVFLNACEAAIAERALSGHGGWAEVLLQARAGAVIAPQWSVGDTIAGAFAKRFYERLRANATVGEAARRTRLAVRREGDPDRLTYAVYASPVARLAAPAPAPGPTAR